MRPAVGFLFRTRAKTSCDIAMTTHDPRAWTAGRAVRFLALATLLSTACAQLLVAAFAEEGDKVALRAAAESGFEPYLDTTPYLSDTALDGPPDLPAKTRRGPRADAPREVFPGPLPTPEKGPAPPPLQRPAP